MIDWRKWRFCLFFRLAAGGLPARAIIIASLRRRRSAGNGRSEEQGRSSVFPSPERRCLNGGNGVLPSDFSAGRRRVFLLSLLELFSFLLPEGLSSFVTGSLFFFRHRKKKQERCHRSESVDDGSGAFPPTPPPKANGRPSHCPLLSALPCGPRETRQAPAIKQTAQNQLCGQMTSTGPPQDQQQPVNEPSLVAG